LLDLDLDQDQDLDQGPTLSSQATSARPNPAPPVPALKPNPKPVEPSPPEGRAAPPGPRPRVQPNYAADPRFVAAWAAYGRDSGKKLAWDQWQKLMPNDELAAEILAGARRHAIAKPDPKFRPDMHRWLRDFRWTEHPPAESAGPPSRFLQHHSEMGPQRLLPDGSLDTSFDQIDEIEAARSSRRHA